MCFYPRQIFSGALICGVRSYLNISKLLPILGSKAICVRENAPEGASCTHSQYFGGFVLHTASSTVCSPCRQILRPSVGHKRLPGSAFTMIVVANWRLDSAKSATVMQDKTARTRHTLRIAGGCHTYVHTPGRVHIFFFRYAVPRHVLRK